MNRQESAQTLALQALGWIASDDERFGAFLAQGGLDAGALRARAADPMIHAAVLDFLLSDDNLVMAFCADTGLAPEEPLRARADLPGGDAPFWT